MDEVLKLGTGLCVGDLFPSLWFLDVVTGLRGRLWRACRQQDELLDKIISQSEMRPRPGMSSSGSMTRPPCADQWDMPKKWMAAVLDKIKEKDVPIPSCWCGDVCKNVQNTYDVHVAAIAGFEAENNGIVFFKVVLGGKYTPLIGENHPAITNSVGLPFVL
ncbi:hypothetical protein ZWY2020_005364 [Hordeum vulgare]|nr:hypothetical protein ZWY2020_005364 [Hordeum vulgare]